ncbi:MAG: PDZ domain-containing protein [Acidobacteriota bacterium]
MTRRLWIATFATASLAFASLAPAHHEESACAADPVRCLSEKRAEIARSASIGASIQETVSPHHGPAFEIVAVEAGGPAAEAGLEAGDLMTGWNGRSNASQGPGAFLDLHRSLRVGQTVTYTIARSQKEFQVKVRAKARSEQSVETSLRRFAWETFGCSYEEVLAGAGTPKAAATSTPATPPGD